MPSISKLSRLPARLWRRDPRVADLPRTGRCDACGRPTIFVRLFDADMQRLLRSWPYPDDYLSRCATRENYFCVRCRRSYRMRMLASVVAPLATGRDVYEAGTFTTLAAGLARRPRSYQVSEYFDGVPLGSSVDGIVNQDLQRLTWAAGSFDLVITTEVFEHVAEPWTAFAEVRRVLRPGGKHIFTVPDTGAPTTVDRTPLPVVRHMDGLRADGIVVVTDYGDDLPDRLRAHGFETTVHAFPPHQPVTRVFESTAV